MSSIDSIHSQSAGTETPPIRSEQRGAHGVAWAAKDGATGPADSVLIVGQDQVEAETRCREWWAGRPQPPVSAPREP